MQYMICTIIDIVQFWLALVQDKFNVRHQDGDMPRMSLYVLKKRVQYRGFNPRNGIAAQENKNA